MYRLILSILSIPAIGCAGEALAQAADPASGLLSQAIASPQGLSWPLAAVVGVYLVTREIRRIVIEAASKLSDWKPPTITLCLQDRRDPPPQP